jgi:hypothetical protein
MFFPPLFQIMTFNSTIVGVGGSAVTLITSAGGRAVTLGASGATGAVGDVTSFYASATAAAG